MTSEELDETFAEIFEKLCIKIRDKKLDYQKIENIEKLDEFDHSKRFWKKNLGNSISSDEILEIKILLVEYIQKKSALLCPKVL